MLRLEEEDIYAGIATSGSSGGDTPESAKGSFNASTQQLTLKYDYLVEKINSSDQLTAETKELIISRLNNSDVVVDMTRDIITTLMGQSSDIAWLFSDGDPTSEDPAEFPTTMMFVSKSNPETSKLVIPDDSGGLVFGSYNALRAIYEMQGQSKTVEEVEALLSSSVVDEEAFTISGTLGNFEVEFIEDAPVVEKYGATISNFLGDVDSNGALFAPTGGDTADIYFTGVKSIDNTANGGLYALTYKFAGCKNIGSVVFPDLVSCRQLCMKNAFINSSITSLSMPKFTGFLNGSNSDSGLCYECASLKSISFPSVVTAGSSYNSYWFYNAFYGCTALDTVDFSNLEEVASSGTGMFSSCFYNCTSLKQAIMFPKLKAIKTQAFYNAFRYSGLETQTFPVLDTLWDRGLQYAFSSCSSLTTLSFPALKSDSFSTYTNVFSNMLSGCSGVTVHFPSNLQSVIGSWSDVTAGFGGTNTTVLFDLTATE